jgi:hypothetical protein
MARSLEHPALYVEGADDLHTIVHLLARHEVILDQDVGPVCIKEATGDQGVLGAMATAAKASSLRPVGFVIDANGGVVDRWRSVRGRLAKLALEIPEVAPLGGFIGRAESLRTLIGIWIMPDNATDAGRLEDLIRTLVPDGDKLIAHAEQATEQAAEIDARFPSQDRMKAVLHCWLAWQAEPGRPFGTALKARFLRHESPVANRFVAWFKRLYGLE